MVDQNTKELAWRLMGPALTVNRAISSVRFRKASGLRLNLGAGRRKIPGFINTDINPMRAPDLWLDIRHGLPFPDGAAAFIYTSHTLEHLQLNEVLYVLKECHRALEDQGTLRIVVPDLGQAIAAYSRRERKWFGKWPNEFKSLGGRFTNYIFCDSQHKTAFDFGFLEELLAMAGFSRVRHADVERTDGPGLCSSDLIRIERELPDANNLIVEAQKGLWTRGGKADVAERVQVI